MKPKGAENTKNTHLYKHEHYYYHSWYIIVVVHFLWFIEFMTCFRHFDNLFELKYAEDGKYRVYYIYERIELCIYV